MALEDVARRVLHVATGSQTAFAFAFTVFSIDQVKVYRAGLDGEEELVVASEYTVTISTTGGTVTFRRAPASGVLIAIVSAIPYTQTMELTNYGGFNPETLNHNADLQAAQIQQLKEQLDRCVKLRPTDTMTAEDLKAQLDTLTEAVEATRSLIVSQDQVTILMEDKASGSTIDLPQGMSYVVGKQCLHVYWNGIALGRDVSFSEVGGGGTTSTQIQILFAMSIGDELIFRTVPSGASIA